MNWIDCRVRLPDIDDKVLIYRKDRTECLVGIYLGNARFHYADCCQGIQKTCSASHWMQLPESPSEDDNIEAVKNTKDPFMEALSRVQKRHARTITMLGNLYEELKMKLNQAPHYEAIGRCVFLKEKIKSLTQSLEKRLSHIYELGIAPFYFHDDKPEIRIREIIIDHVEKLANETKDIYSDIYRSAVEYNKWAALAGYEIIMIDYYAKQNS